MTLLFVGDAMTSGPERTLAPSISPEFAPTSPSLPPNLGSSVLVPLRFDRAELAGAVADLGVLVPIAVALIVKNGLQPTAVLLPAGLLYLFAGLLYRVPVPVQPLKAFGVIAIAKGLGPSEIAAGALLMGGVFVVLGASGWLDRVAKVFPLPILRGIQLSVGLLFCRLAWTLTTSPPAEFNDHVRPIWWLLGGAIVVTAVALLLRRRNVSLILVALAVVCIVFGHDGPLRFGPSSLHVPEFGIQTLTKAAFVLVLPQLPLTFANACLATADVAHAYFGSSAQRVQPGRLALSLGFANVLAGLLSGMPVCHGAGGLTAHYSFGARTGGAPILIGTILLILALAIGAGLAGILAGIPLPILAGLLAVSGLLHTALLKDLRHPYHWVLALAVGVIGFVSNLAVALVASLLLWWAGKAVVAQLRR